MFGRRILSLRPTLSQEWWPKVRLPVVPEGQFVASATSVPWRTYCLVSP